MVAVCKDLTRYISLTEINKMLGVAKRQIVQGKNSKHTTHTLANKMEWSGMR